jgi:2-amino-4-hydroxy-6-hydroxymethyldihydropteridine diphosphokinase
MNYVYLLMGSNIVRGKNIQRAIRAVAMSNILELQRISSTWLTKAVGSDADDFLNLAVNIHTNCELDCLKEMVIGEIEKQLGRVRTEDKYAPRTIDLDVIVFNDQVIDSDIFSLDHIILPMAELLPELHSPELDCTLWELAEKREKQTQAVKMT